MDTLSKQNGVATTSGDLNGAVEALADDKSVYLFVLASQTFSSEQVSNCLNQICSSLTQLDASLASHRDELVNTLRNEAFDDNSNFDQEYRIGYKSENGFQFELQINSKIWSFKTGLKDFLVSSCKRKYLVCSSFDYNSAGDIHLQDGTFSFDDFNMLANGDDEVKRSLQQQQTAASNTKIGIYLSTRLVENNRAWKSLEKAFGNLISLHGVSSKTISSQQVVDSPYNDFVLHLRKYFNEKPAKDLMELSKYTGTLKIAKPVLYIFPAREGDSSFFTINGFSLLINGGYDRVRPCFWKFVNMLQQIDTVLITHNDSDTLGGLSSFFSKKLSDADVKPSILTVLGNLVNESPAAKTLSIQAANSIANEISGSDGSCFQTDSEVIIEAINKLNIKLIPLIKNMSLDHKVSLSHSLGSGGSSSKYEHINLYYKLGQGSLDLYVLSPFSNSSEYKEFIQQQQAHLAKHAAAASKHKSQLEVNQVVRTMPLSHLNSAVVLLVWLPFNNYSVRHHQHAPSHENTALRLLFTGNAPQHVILSALDKVKDFDIISQPVYKTKPSGDIPLLPTGSSSGPSQTLNKKISTSSLSANNTSMSGEHKKAATDSTDSVSAKPARTSANASSSAIGHSASKQATNNESDKKPPVSKPKEAKETTNGVAASSTASNKPPVAATKKPADSKPPVDSAAANVNTKKKSVAPAAGASDANKEAKTVNGTTKESTKESGDKKTASTSKPPSATLHSRKPTSDSNENKVLNGTDSKASKPAATAAKSSEKPAPKPAPSASTSKSTSSTTSKVQTSPSTKESGPSAFKKSSGKPTSSAAAATADQTKKEPESRIITKRNSKVVEAAAAKAAAAAAVAAAGTPPPPSPSATPNATSSSSNTPQAQQPALVDEIATPKQETQADPVAPPEQVPEVGSSTVDQVKIEEVEVEEVPEQVEEVPTQTSSDVVESVEHTEVVVEQTEVVEEKVEVQVEEKQQADDEEDVHQEQDVESEAQVDDEVQKHVIDEVQHDLADDDVQQHQQEIEEVQQEHIEEVQQEQIEEVQQQQVEEDQHDLVNEVIEQVPQVTPVVEESMTKNQSLPEQEGLAQAGNKDDVMTRSFIEDPANPKSNPFLEQEGRENVNGHQNGHHQNGNHENGHYNNDDSLDELSMNHFQQTQKPVSKASNGVDLDNFLTNELEGLNLNDRQQQQSNENPANWNLLELPKPVNPNDIPAPSNTSTLTASNNDRKAIDHKKVVSSPLAENGGTSKLLKTAAAAKQPATASKSLTYAKVAHPVYLEVCYIPAHGSSHYSDIEFFRRVRSRHYILSTQDPSEELLNALIKAKETWGETPATANFQVSIIPTYESDVLRRWFIANEEKLAKLRIDVYPAANLSTLTMDDNPELTSHVYKLEF